MITAHSRIADGYTSIDIKTGETLPVNSLWIDVLSPSPEEEKELERQLGIEIPTREEVWKNGVLNRFYEENGVQYMTAAIITKLDTPYPQTSAVTFIFSKNYLVTIRYISPTSFNNFTRRLHKSPKRLNSSVKIFEALLEEIITRVAYNSELVVNELDDLSHQTFSTDNIMTKKRQSKSQSLGNVLKKLGKSADLNSKINESLHSLQRMVGYLRQIHGAGKEMDKAIDILSSDVTALMKQSHFLSDKITFIQDATLGMINIEQNLIIKILSVATLFFMPPTLLSSIYGMNFKHMPELEFIFGYPMVIGLMFLCASMSFLYFRKKGWL